MPRTCRVDPALDRLITAQDQVVTRAQALAHGMTRHAIAHRVQRGGWQPMIAGVYLCHGGEASRRQLMVAALLYAGTGSAIDDVDACKFHGVRAAAMKVRRRRARRRTFMAAARRTRSDRQVLALISDAVQRNVVTHQQLMEAHVRAARRNLAPIDTALEQVGVGVRSLPEGDFRRLAEANPLLPRLVYNRRLRLPDGRIIRPDALAPDAALVHECNGRRAHRRVDLFEDMQIRHDVMTVAGLTVLHNTPRRISLRGREVIAEFERCYLRDAGRGLPPGVLLLPED
jgi:hypothetical protein